MRQLILMGLLVASTLPAGAAKKVTVAQLEQIVTAETASHKPAAEIARKIGAVELSERLTDAALAPLKAQLEPGSAAALALQLLADQSEFLDPPSGELPADPAPDTAAQLKMLVAARAYVAQTLPRLPNFLSIRTINRFDDSPQAPAHGGWAVRAGLHPVDTSNHEISSLAERENEPLTQGSAVWQEQFGLISGGEFGNTLGMVMSDTLQGEVAWSHWEQTPAGQAAVFRYDVPRSASHFVVIGSREKSELVGFGSVTRGSASSRRGVQPGDPANTTIVRSRPSYHGTFSLDPSTGAVLRITISAEAKDGAPFKQAGILVQYGPVQIADRQFICPTRSLALSVAVPDPNTISGDAPTEWLNETLFSGYRRFAATTRLLPGAPEAPTGTTGSASQAAQVAPSKPDEPAPAMASAVPPSDAAPASIPLNSATPSTPAPSAPTLPNPANSAPALPDTTAPIPTASTPTPPVPQPASESPSAGPTIQVNVNRALVPVVVRDKKGSIVTGLTKEDFTVFDNDKPHPIAAFTVERREPRQTRIGSNPNISESMPPTSTSPASPAPSSATPDRFTVFLFDDMHVTFEDLANVKKTAIKAVDEALEGSDMTVVLSTSGKTSSGPSRDRTKLRDAIMSLQPHGISLHDSVACPKLDYYQADLIENKHDDEAARDAVAQVLTCNPGMPESMAVNIAQMAARNVVADSRQDVLNTYATIAEFVRRIATLPGQRTLILVSSGFVTIDPEALAAQSRLIDLAAKSNLPISALDARGVYSGTVTAGDDTRGRSPETITQMRRSAGLQAGSGLQDLADGTGGTFFHNSNDLGAGFKTLIEPPEVVYLLELSLNDEKPDGKFHRLKVKVDRDHVQVQSRSGYTSPGPEKSRKSAGAGSPSEAAAAPIPRTPFSESATAVAAPAPMTPSAPASTLPAPTPQTPTPPVPQPANEPQTGGYTIEMNVNRVLIPVVVRDKAGQIVSGLKKEDFSVFDNDKPRSLSAFTIEQRGSPANAPANAPNDAPAPTSANAPPPGGQRFIVFLFDDLHLAPEDLVRVRNAGANVLDSALSPTNIAAVLSLSGKTNSGLTRDHTVLRNAIMGLEARNTFRPDPRACPNISYYQAVQIENEHSHDGSAFQEAFKQVINCNPSLDPTRQQNVIENEVTSAANRALNLGRQDAQITFANLSAFVHTIGALPGQHMIVFISPGLVALEQESIGFESRVLDLAAQLNVTLSVLDARGLYVADLSADASQGGFAVSGSTVQQQADYRRTSILVAESTLAALADGTGGTFFHNSNDLGAGFKSLVEPPGVVYLLELSLNDEKPDGKFHRLKVKVDRDHVRVQSRSSYTSPRPENNKK